MLEELTDMEQKIARMVSQGMSARDIGKVIGYHERTINNILSNIYKKLGFRDGCKVAKLSVLYAKENKERWR